MHSLNKRDVRGWAMHGRGYKKENEGEEARGRTREGKGIGKKKGCKEEERGRNMEHRQG